jgi:hypothetical protein
MRRRNEVAPLGHYRWQAEHASQDLRTVRTAADTKDAALETFRGEIRYRLELCPCSGESYRHIEIELET